MSTSVPPSSPQALTDPRRDLLETTLGAQYEVLRLLGQGGAGVVYLARERLLERLVAIKLLRSEVVSAESRERFVREARTAARLMHPHIVPLYAFGQAGDTLYYIMGFVEGESLETLLQRAGRCDADESRRILVEIADALGYAHRSGVIHRDVKPDNVLIERESRRAILTDFGIAKTQATQSTLTATGMIVGTPLYMSPEQAAGDSAVDGRSDLYSLGVIGYRMIAGRLPIEGSSAQDVMRRHVTQDPQPLSEVAPHAPLDLAWAVTRCLDKDPGGRWPTVEAFRQALESADEPAGELPEPLEHLSGAGVRVVIGGWIATAMSILLWARTGSSGWVAAAGGVVALTIAGTLLLYFRAARFGLTGIRAWRLLAAPAEQLAGWWPPPFRRSGDEWTRLPAAVRRARATRTMMLGTLTWLGLPVLAAIVLRIGPVTAALAAAAAFTLAGAAYGVARSMALDELRRHGVPARAFRRWMAEPTWGSSFWRRSEVLPLLARQPAAAASAIDTSEKDQYCVITPVQPEIPHGMFDHIDPRSPTPLYAQIASRLRVAIASGELRPGDGLPSVRQLSGRLRINPATVVQAYRELEVEGLVSTRQGAGTFVQEVAPDRRTQDRAMEARRLVRDMLAQAGSIGITAVELRSAMEQELKTGARS